MLNQATVATVVACNKEHDTASHMSLEAVLNPSPRNAFWLKSVKARCKGDEAGARAAMYDAVGGSGARLSIMRPIAPYDRSLASLAANSHPDQAEAHFWLADALVMQGDTETAIREYEIGLAQNGTDANAWLSFGNLHRDKGDMLEAAEAYDQACRYVDQGKHGCIDAARIYLDIGRYEVAAEHFESSIKQFGYPFIPAEEGLVTALVKLGRNEEAIPHLTILAMNGSSKAQETLDQLQGSDK